LNKQVKETGIDRACSTYEENKNADVICWEIQKESLDISWKTVLEQRMDWSSSGHRPVESSGGHSREPSFSLHFLGNSSMAELLATSRESLSSMGLDIMTLKC
jgi:hypothetical protein